MREAQPTAAGRAAAPTVRDLTGGGPATAVRRRATRPLWRRVRPDAGLGCRGAVACIGDGGPALRGAMRGAGIVDSSRARMSSVVVPRASASYDRTRRCRRMSGATSNTSWGRT